MIGGVLHMLMERLVQAGGAVPPSLDTGYSVPFNPEIFKSVALDLLDDGKVYYLLHAFASGVILDSDAVRGVVLETKSGPLVVQARVTIDCTGDGDIAAYSGAEFELGREEDKLTQPMSLLFRVAQFNRAGFAAYAADHPDQWSGVHGLWDLVERAAAEGALNLQREDILMFATPYGSEVSVNSTRVTKVLGTDVWDLTHAERESRRQLQEIVAFLRRSVPGFEESYLVDSGTQIGVRETRRIRGDYHLTARDLLRPEEFQDVIALGTYPLDIHNPAGKGTILMRPPAGAAYQIPLRALLPRRVEQLLTAGRCISGTHEALSGYRAMPIAMATGQAAGVCAALAASRREAPRGVDYREVQQELRRQDAILPEAGQFRPREAD